MDRKVRLLVVGGTAAVITSLVAGVILLTGVFERLGSERAVLGTAGIGGALVGACLAGATWLIRWLHAEYRASRPVGEYAMRISPTPAVRDRLCQVALRGTRSAGSSLRAATARLLSLEENDAVNSSCDPSSALTESGAVSAVNRRLARGRP